VSGGRLARALAWSLGCGQCAAVGATALRQDLAPILRDRLACISASCSLWKARQRVGGLLPDDSVRHSGICGHLEDSNQQTADPEGLRCAWEPATGASPLVFPCVYLRREGQGLSHKAVKSEIPTWPWAVATVCSLRAHGRCPPPPPHDPTRPNPRPESFRQCVRERKSGLPFATIPRSRKHPSASLGETSR
jgi:hypothetical protein